jgi:hypothetical protein
MSICVFKRKPFLQGYFFAVSLVTYNYLVPML